MLVSYTTFATLNVLVFVEVIDAPYSVPRCDATRGYVPPLARCDKMRDTQSTTSYCWVTHISLVALNMRCDCQGGAQTVECCNTPNPSHAAIYPLLCRHLSSLTLLTYRLSRGVSGVIGRSDTHTQSECASSPVSSLSRYTILGRSNAAVLCPACASSPVSSHATPYWVGQMLQYSVPPALSWSMIEAPAQ